MASSRGRIRPIEWGPAAADDDDDDDDSTLLPLVRRRRRLESGFISFHFISLHCSSLDDFKEKKKSPFLKSRSPRERSKRELNTTEVGYFESELVQRI